MNDLRSCGLQYICTRPQYYCSFVGILCVFVEKLTRMGTETFSDFSRASMDSINVSMNDIKSMGSKLVRPTPRWLGTAHRSAF